MELSCCTPRDWLSTSSAMDLRGGRVSVDLERWTFVVPGVADVVMSVQCLAVSLFCARPLSCRAPCVSVCLAVSLSCPVLSRPLSCRAPCVSVCLAVSLSFEPPVPCECDAGSCSRTAPSRPREQETTAEARDIGDFRRRGQSSRTPSLVCVCHVCLVWPCLTPTRQLASPTIASAIVVSTHAPAPTRLFTPLRELDVS